MSDEKPDNIQDLLYHLTVLYERWIADKLELTKQIAKTEQLTKDFNVRVHEFKGMNITLRNDFDKTLRATGQEINKEIANTVKQTISSELTGVVDELKKVTSESQKELESWRTQAGLSVVWAIIIAVVSSFLVSFLTVKFLLPEPTLALTNEQAGFLTGGQVISRIYPKLTPAEQKHLNDLSGEFAQDLFIKYPKE